MASISQQIFSLLTYLTILQAYLVSSSKPPALVKVDLYYESLCPYSADFITSQLPKIFTSALIDIVELRYFPWGNARLSSNDSFTCQHGPDECLLNTVEACAIDALNERDHILFIDCVENLVYEGKHTHWESCFKKYSLSSKSIMDCYMGEDGKQLELKYAAATSALKPPHTFVPWVVIDGKPLYDKYDDFVKTICKAYKGPSPAICKIPSVASGRKEKTNHAHVTYAEQTRKMSFLMKIWSFITSWKGSMI